MYIIHCILEYFWVLFRYTVIFCIFLGNYHKTAGNIFKCFVFLSA